MTDNHCGRALWYDAIAWTIFVIAGIATHRPSSGGLASAIASSCIIAASWFICAAVTNFYSTPISLLGTAQLWICAGTIGLVARTLLRWRALVPAFAVVTLLIGGVAVLGWRGIWLLIQRRSAT